MSENVLLPVRLEDGLTVEAVWYGSGTLCISSQGGCSIGCPFCASGSRGFLRHLTLEEMIRQVECSHGTWSPHKTAYPFGNR